jgi:hypothetical protein
MADYYFADGTLRHANCGGQIAVEAEVYVFAGIGFPRPAEARGCMTEPGPHGTTITRTFGGYRGFCMKCEKEGIFYGPRYRPPRARRIPRSVRSSRRRLGR